MKYGDVKEVLKIAGKRVVEVHVLGAQRAFVGKVSMMQSQEGVTREVILVEGETSAFISIEHIVAIGGTK
ncbi:hypothetical protein RSO01_68180 [Reyranella soli]|uniref:Uncharacterized protein n=1 Tax=Reyranella soli TaxID=1230389 RepID=A0A512NL37_9HYPH|nr:hypothetical protein RSO01_68180 [Reyranella soli]